MPHDNQHIDRQVEQQNCADKSKNLENLSFNIIDTDSNINNLILNELSFTDLPKRSSVTSSTYTDPKHGLGKNV